MIPVKYLEGLNFVFLRIYLAFVHTLCFSENVNFFVYIPFR